MNEPTESVPLSEAEIKHQRRLAQYRKYYATHKEKAQKYYQENKDKFAKRGREWREKNPEKYKAKCRGQYSKNRERRIASVMKSHKKHAAKRKAYMDQWRSENQEHIRQYEKRKRETPEGRIAAIQAAHKRTALKNKCEVRATKTQLAKFIAKATHCHYCDRSDVRMTVDHFMPLSRGGAHSLDNIVAACKSCNSKKRDRDPHEFLSSIGRLL